MQTEQNQEQNSSSFRGKILFAILRTTTSKNEIPNKNHQ